MKPELALRLLGGLMKWEFLRANEEFKWLNLLVEYKYDHYQGYSPGARFLINLINWLKQFPTIEKREVAYKFIRERLVFINQREMHHLIDLSMPLFDCEARRLVAKELGLKFYETWNDVNAARRLRLLKMRTLYVALSDGAHIDIFRRDNEGDVSNEQVVPLAEISPQKWDSLFGKLRKRLDAEDFSNEDALFERICLIDDFTGSGFTLVRFDNGKWDGKVHNFCHQCETNGKMGTRVKKGCTVHVHHYLASTKAKESITQELEKYEKSSTSFSFTKTFSYVLPQDIVVSHEDNDQELVSLISEFYDESIQSTHTTTHTSDNISYGYRQCGLPLVLDHNTPNNSVALLWAKSKDSSVSPQKMRPLFHRKERHIDHGKK
ncbi:MAG: hypothetical protein IFNCLDLE_02014 [Ignavibacteriaceae bacterium]|nr:hypothetical protein [Ignavibacteriaceae bacterium]